MSRTTPSDQLRTLQPLPVPEDEYDLDEQRTSRRQIEQNFQSIASNLEETRRLTDREAIYADLEMNWITSCCCCSELSQAITPSNLEAELEALTTTDLNMSGVDNLTIGDSLTFDQTSDWTITAGTTLAFARGGVDQMVLDPASERILFYDTAGNQRARLYGLDSTPAFYLAGPQPTIYLNEQDTTTDEGWTAIRMNGGQLYFYSLTDAGATGDELMLFNRNGTEWNYGELSCADMRRRTNEYAASNVDVYERYYTKGTGDFYFERRRESDSALAWRILSSDNGDFNLQNYNWTGTEADRWMEGDVSTGDFDIGGNTVNLLPDTYVGMNAQFCQPSGLVAATTTGGYTVTWDDGYAWHIDLSGNTTITVDGGEARRSGLYMLQISNSSGTSYSVTWSGVDTWNGTAPTTLATGRTHYVMLHVIENLAKSAVRVVGEALVNNVSWT